MKLSGSAMGAAVQGRKKEGRVREVSWRRKFVELKELKGGRGEGGCRRKELIEASEERPTDEGV